MSTLSAEQLLAGAAELHEMLLLFADEFVHHGALFHWDQSSHFTHEQQRIALEPRREVDGGERETGEACLSACGMVR